VALEAKRTKIHSARNFKRMESAQRLSLLLFTACTAASPRDNGATVRMAPPVVAPRDVGSLPAHAVVDAGRTPAFIFALHPVARSKHPIAHFPRRTGTPVALRAAPLVSTCDVDTVETVVTNFDASTDVSVSIALVPAAARAFEDFTASNVGDPLAVVIDGVVVDAIPIRARIVGGHISIEARSIEEANELVRRMRARAECG
jgi:hypothetical protein